MAFNKLESIIPYTGTVYQGLMELNLMGAKWLRKHRQRHRLFGLLIDGQT